MSKRVRANANAVVVFKTKPRAITEGMELDADDDVVRDYPWLFTEEIVERQPEKRTRRRNVERATAAPGELRDVTLSE